MEAGGQSLGLFGTEGRGQVRCIFEMRLVQMEILSSKVTWKLVNFFAHHWIASFLDWVVLVCILFAANGIKGAPSTLARCSVI